MTNTLDGMYDLKDANINISVGDGRKMTTLKIGKWKGVAIDSEGRKSNLILTNVSYVPQLMVNLFSLTAAMEKGLSVTGTKEGIEIRKETWLMRFDRKIGTPRGHVFATSMIPSENYEQAQANLNINYEQAHAVLGHPGQNILLATAERMNWNLSRRDAKECKECLQGKAQRMQVNKTTNNHATKPGERLMIDISTVKTQNSKKIGRYWLLIVDEATNMKWSYFLKSKEGQVSVIIGLIKRLNNDGKTVKFIRCDNAGENVALQNRIEEEGINVSFEYTARQTPQQNGKVERAFATLYGRMRAMMIGANWSEEMKRMHWTEAAATATKLDNILNEKGKESPHRQFYKEDPLYEKYLRTFGEKGIVTLNPGGSIKAKLEDRGTECIFVGYAANHAGNVYRMINPKTNKVLMTRDVRWLNKVNERINCNETENKCEIFLEHDQIITPEAQNTEDPVPQEQNIDENNTGEVNHNRQRLLRELKGLQSFNRPGRLEIQGENAELCFFVPSYTRNENDTPVSFQDAWYHKLPHIREKWREAIRLEYKQMIKNGVWRKDAINDIPNNRKGIGTKWVFKEKKNGIFRARLVAKGYDQIAGIDFQYNFAPVTSEVTLRILLVIWIVQDYFAEVADVQTAFLHGDLEEELFIKIPSGYKEFLEEQGDIVNGKFLKLEKSTYGLVQAARSWWKKFTSVLKDKLGFEQFENDSCLLKKESKAGKVYLIVYVDDCFVVGDKMAVREALSGIEKHFSITRSEHIEDFIGCHIERDGNKILLSQPDLINKLISKFGAKIEKLKQYETPAPAGTHVIRCTDDEATLDDSEQNEFRSGVGSLLYLLKHSRPELSNSVRELSKVMDRANKAHQKALLRVIKFVSETRDRHLVLSPISENFSWELKAYSDSDFAGDTESRKSVSGFIIYLCGVAISWRSKGQKSVSLSSTEAEYMAISEVTMEILYIVGILKFLGIPLQYPIEVKVDNIGAVYLSKNATTGNRTKHIDTRYHFVREYIEDGIVKVIFVRSEENDADIFTKNLNQETFKRHCDSIGLEDLNEPMTPKMGNRKGVEIGGLVFPTCVSD